LVRGFAASREKLGSDGSDRRRVRLRRACDRCGCSRACAVQTLADRDGESRLVVHGSARRQRWLHPHGVERRHPQGAVPDEALHAGAARRRPHSVRRGSHPRWHRQARGCEHDRRALRRPGHEQNRGLRPDEPLVYGSEASGLEPSSRACCARSRSGCQGGEIGLPARAGSGRPPSSRTAAQAAAPSPGSADELPGLPHDDPSIAVAQHAVHATRGRHVARASAMDAHVRPRQSLTP
jgi:hypothetical protein